MTAMLADRGSTRYPRPVHTGMVTFMFVTLLTLIFAQAAPAQAVAVTKGPTAMTRSEIRAYNAQLPPGHPASIRCVNDEETGSLVRKKTKCRTLAEWRRVEDVANGDARDIIDNVNLHGSTHGG